MTYINNKIKNTIMIFLDNLYLEKSLWCSDIYDDTYIYVGIIINPLPYMVQSVSLYN